MPAKAGILSSTGGITTPQAVHCGQQRIERHHGRTVNVLLHQTKLHLHVNSNIPTPQYGGTALRLSCEQIAIALCCFLKTPASHQ